MKQIFTAILCILILNSTRLTAQVNVQDSLALVDLYNSTGGAYWDNHHNWLTKEPVSKWHGVYVTKDRVTQLILFYNSLGGSIPSSIGNLTSLQYLDLSSNYGLGGSIPSSIGNLTSLQQLDLLEDELSGSIPSSIGNLSSLQYLDLSGNYLSGSIPSSIGNLSSLQDLDLGANNLDDSIPSSIGNLSSLQDLFLGFNKLSGNIPSSIGNLTSLTGLSLSSNILSSSVPSSIGNLTNLTALQLDQNQLSDIPSSINNLTKLAFLNLYSNNLKHFPSIGNLTMLDYLNLSRNQISGDIPSFIGNLTNLNTLYLNENRLTGKIPSSLGNLTNLVYLWLNTNQLSGSIPTELYNLTKLKELTLSHNHLSDTIPPLFKLKNLSLLQFEHNKFTFAGMGRLVTTFPFAYYSPQAIIPLHYNNNTLSVSVGSIPYHNTYKWKKDGVLYKTKVGDSTLQVTTGGAYYVTVTNSVATKLTLHSDTVYVTDNDLIASQTSELNTQNNFTSISLYPNPAKTFATLSFNADGKYSITIADVSGKILQTKTGVAIKSTNIIQLDVSNYASGLYLITITDEKNKKQIIKLSKE